MIKISIRWFNRMLWTVIVTVLVLTATYVSLGRYYIDYVDDFQPQLVSRFKEATGLPVSVGKLYGYWSFLSPVITLEEVVLNSPDGDSVLSINSVSFQLDVLNTIRQRTIQANRLFIDGVNTDVEEASPGNWSLRGYPVGQSQADAEEGFDLDAIIDLILSVDGARLTDANIVTYQFDGDAALLLISELSLRHEDNFRRLKLLAALDDEENPFSAIIETNGDPREVEEFSAKAHIKFDDVDFSSQLPTLRGLGIDLQQAKIDSELWLDLRPGAELSAHGVMSTPYLDIAALGGVGDGTDLAPVEALELSFHVERTEDADWQIWIPKFEFSWQDKAFDFHQLIAEIEAEYAYLRMASLSLDTARDQLLSLEMLPDRAKQILEALSPAGELTSVHIQLSRPNVDESETGGINDFSLRANLDDVAVQSWRGSPVAKGVAGYLEVKPRSGMVELDAENLSMHFPHVYHHELLFGKALAQLTWQVDQERILVNSGEIHIQGEYGPAVGLLGLNLPLKKEFGYPQMDLAIGITGFDASYRNLFIPHTLNKDFLQWMENSVPEGRVNKGGFVFRGSLQKVGGLNRTVQLFLDVENTTLDYNSEWPVLTDIEGTVLVDDVDVVVTANSAKVYDLDVANTVVNVNRDQQGMWLTINAEAKGNSADALKVVNESYLATVVGDTFKTWQLQGDVSTALKLGIPLAGNPRANEIDVNVQLANSELKIPDYNVSFENIIGPLTYHSDRGIDSTGITAELYGKAVSVTVRQNNNEIDVDMSGRVAMSDVATWSQQPAMTFVQGETDFKANIHVEPNAENGANVFTVRSNLKGVSVDLPAPFNKSVESEQAFQLQQTLSAESELQMLWQDLAELHIQFDQGEALGALVVVGEADQGVDRDSVADNQVTFTGSLPFFDLDEWLPVFDRYQVAVDELGDGEHDNVEDQADARVGARQLHIKKAIALEQEFDEVTVGLEQGDEHWTLSADNAMLAGSIVFFDDDAKPMQVQLERLSLPVETVSGDSESDGEGGLAGIDPVAHSGLAVDVAVADLSIGETGWGSISFELRGISNGLLFNNLAGNIRGITMTADEPLGFEWLKEGDIEQSRLYGDFRFKDLGRVIQQWGYERFIVTDRGQVSLDLTWQGRPDEWQLNISEGPLYVKLDDGRFLGASDAATGALKVVGIVNLTNILRRLQLDFSDLSKSGISFDRIEGETILSNRELIIVDDVLIKSPSSRFHLYGSADLDQSLLDMELIVTLPVANNLPWIAALAGGLPTAAGVYVASKIFEKQVDQLSSAVYTVQGDWNEPELAFSRVFDSNRNNKNSKQDEKNGAKTSPDISPSVDPPPEKQNELSHND